MKGFVSGGIIAVLWILSFRYIIKTMVFMTILIYFGIFGYIIYFSINKYISIKNSNYLNHHEIKLSFNLEYLRGLKALWLALAIIQIFIVLVMLVIIMYLKKHFKLATELINEATKAIIMVPTLIFWPIIPFLLEVIFLLL